MKKFASYLTKLPDAEYGVPKPISGLVNYCLDSWWQKIDYRNSKIERVPEEWVPEDPFSHIRELWIGSELCSAVTLNQQYPKFAKSLNAYAFNQLFCGENAQYRIVPFLDSYEFKGMLKDSYNCRVQSEQISISLNTPIVVPVFGNFFVEHIATGVHLHVKADFCFEQLGCSLSIMSSPENQLAIEAFFAAMQSSIILNDIYYKKCTTFVGGRLDFCAVTKNTWGDVVLKEDIKQHIQDNTVNVLNHSEELTSLGMCPNRNMILVSPPGTAKTTIFRAISTEVEGNISRIWCTGKSIGCADDVTALFEAARSLAPCIIFIEDMDLHGGDRLTSDNGRILNEFLACLDGQQENAGVVVMASTNDIASMDEALVNRPGRFDEKIEIPLPDAGDRNLMLRSFFEKMSALPDESITPQIWKTVIDLTDGLTGAYLSSLAKSTVIRAVSEGRMIIGDAGSVAFSAGDLNSAAERVIKNYAIGKRAKKHHTYQDSGNVGSGLSP